MIFLPPFPVTSVKDWPLAIQDWFRQLRQVFTAYLTKAVGGSSDVNLTADESRANIIECTGVLTGNINVIVSVFTKSWVVKNKTTGAFTLKIKTSGGAGIIIGSGKAAIVYCDGTDVVRATADV